MRLVPCWHPELYESLIRSGLVELAERSPRPLHPDCLLRGVATGQFFLWLGFDEAGACQGWMLTERVEGDDPRLNIVAAVGRCAIESWEDGMWVTLENHARSLGCGSVEFLANRPGWERHAKRLGFFEKLRVYVRAVEAR